LNITIELLQQFKDRMHFTHNSEDSNLQRLLSFSISEIKTSCGTFDVYGEGDINSKAKELVFERTRYAYNDAVEYFNENFSTEINSLAILIAMQEMGEEDASI
jgi:hypothetical protein